jgi:hypothetical protein
MNVKHILEGLGNSLFVKEEVEKIANKRMEICKVCPKNSANRNKDNFKPGKFFNTMRPDVHCTMCACNLHAKVRSLATECPIGSWGPEATKEEAIKIVSSLN